MDILYLLIPLSVVLVFAIGAIFWYALRSGQFDDLEGPALKILLDDDRAPSPEENLSPDKPIDGPDADAKDDASRSPAQRG